MATYKTNYYAFYPDDPRSLFFEDSEIEVQQTSSTPTTGKVMVPERWSDLDPFLYWYDPCFNNLWNQYTHIQDVKNTFIRGEGSNCKWLTTGSNAYNQKRSDTSLEGSPYVGINTVNGSNMFRNAYKMEGSPVFGPKQEDASWMYYDCNGLTGFCDIPSTVKNLNKTFYMSSSTYKVSPDSYGGVWNCYSDDISDVRNMWSHVGDNAYPYYTRRALHLKINRDTTTHSSFKTQSVIGTSKLTDVTSKNTLSYGNLFVHYDPDWEYTTIPLKELRIYKDLSKSYAQSDWTKCVNNARMKNGINVIEMDAYSYHSSQFSVKCEGITFDDEVIEGEYGLAASYSDWLLDIWSGYDGNTVVFGLPSTFYSDLSHVYPDQISWYGDMTNAFKDASGLTTIPSIGTYYNCYYSITNMYSTFENMTSAVSMDTRIADFGNCTDSSRMFYDCYKLASPMVDRDFHSVVNAENMYFNCRNITSLPKYESVETLRNAFNNCVNAVANVSEWDLTYCTDYRSAFDNAREAYGNLVIPSGVPTDFNNTFSHSKIENVVFMCNVSDFNGMFDGDTSLRYVYFNNDAASLTLPELETHMVGVFSRDVDDYMDIWLPNSKPGESGMSLLRQFFEGDWQPDGRYHHDSKAFGVHDADGYHNREIYWNFDPINKLYYNTEAKINIHFGTV